MLTAFLLLVIVYLWGAGGVLVLDGVQTTLRKRLSLREAVQLVAFWPVVILAVGWELLNGKKEG